jgi:predicted permease
MIIFLTLLSKILPLYLIIILGYITGRCVSVAKETVANLLIYVLVPIVIFNGVLRAHIDSSMLSLPLVFFCLAYFMCIGFYFFGSLFWPGSEKNILAYTAGTGNTGYFGLPVAIALWGPNVVSVVILAIFGFILYEGTLGFFISARGACSRKDSFLHVLKLPTIYAFLLGLLLNFFGVKFGSSYYNLVSNFQGAYTILGMMLIGLGIASIEKFSFDVKFIGFTFLAKFIAWPILVISLIILDKIWLHFYTPQIHEVMLLMATVPLAANMVAFATIFKIHPEKASLAVLLSTLFALFYIPLVIALYRLFGAVANN